MQQDFAIAAHRERLSIGREPQRGDHRRLVVDGGLARHHLGGRIVLRAGFDPIAKCRDIGRGERRQAKRHRRLHGCGDELDHEALFRRTGHERRSAFATGLEPGVGRQIEVRLFRSGLMATGAVLVEDGPDVTSEFDWVGPILLRLRLRRRVRDPYWGGAEQHERTNPSENSQNHWAVASCAPAGSCVKKPMPNPKSLIPGIEGEHPEHPTFRDFRETAGRHGVDARLHQFGILSPSREHRDVLLAVDAE